MAADVRSFAGKPFTVSGTDCRCRDPDDLTRFVKWAAGDAMPPGAKAGDHKLIPDNQSIAIDDVRMEPAGGGSFMLFVHAAPAGGGAPFGWTSVGNVKGKMIGETLGATPPPPNTNRFGAHAAWERGVFLRQITLVSIVGTGGEIKRVAEHTVDNFMALTRAARAAGRSITMNSGFRSFPEQQHLHDGFKRGLPGFNRAAAPGRSNHQNGIAFDLAVKPGDGNPDYEWMKRHATEFGFLRTVASEPWHWEFKPDRARLARANNRFFEFP